MVEQMSVGQQVEGIQRLQEEVLEHLFATTAAAAGGRTAGPLLMVHRDRMLRAGWLMSDSQVHRLVLSR